MRLLRELEEIARKTAVLAEQSIKDAELSSRVSRSTGSSGRTLTWGSLILCQQLKDRSVSTDEPTLYAHVSWWWTNEEGYSGNLGMKFIGAFGDAGFGSPAKPDPSRFREHPLLRVGKGPGTGKGTIQNPIPAREFVKDGAVIAEAAWHAQIRAAKARFIREVRAGTPYADGDQAAAGAQRRRGEGGDDPTARLESRLAFPRPRW